MLHICPVSCVPYVASFSRLSFFITPSVFSNMYLSCVLCTLCCQFLWIVLVYYLTSIYSDLVFTHCVHFHKLLQTSFSSFLWFTILIKQNYHMKSSIKIPQFFFWGTCLNSYMIIISGEVNSWSHHVTVIMTNLSIRKQSIWSL